MKNLPLLALTMISIPLTAHAQNDTKTIPIKDNMFVIISPQGGNIVASTGENGTFIVDNNLSERGDTINNAITSLTGEHAKFVLNTHYHFDHTGTNELMGAQGATIIAHDTVRERLSTEQVISYFGRTMPPLNENGLPTVTFSENATFHYNNDAIKVTHTPAAHTDGDAFAHFTNANIIAAGDIVFNGIYPFIDTEHGGSIKGTIKAVETILAAADNDTIIIPGHGQIMSKADLENYHHMLSTIAGKIENAIAQEQSLEQTIASKPTVDFDPSINEAFIAPDAFVTILYNNLNDKEKAHTH
jgi:cyclase